MGLIKAAMLGGVAFYAIKSLKGDRENGCGRRRRSDAAEGTRAMTDEKPAESFYNSSSNSNSGSNNSHVNPPSYPVDQYPFPSTPYQNERYTPQTSPHQQMVFVEPRQPYNAIEAAPYLNEKQKYTAMKSVPVQGTGHEDAIQQAMRHLNSGDQEKARQILAGAVGQKY